MNLYRRTMCRRSLYRFNKALYFLSLKGMGIGNWETPEVSGERDFLTRFAGHVPGSVVVDVGANIGSYSALLKSLDPSATIFAFEPHPETFKELEISARNSNFQAIQLALGEESGSDKLYDYAANRPQRGSEHASMLRDVIEDMHAGESQSWDIETTTLDEFTTDHSIAHIDLLKIDVEGGELKVLQGATDCIEREMVDLIHFEFTEASMVSRVFMKDFFRILPNYDFYRMLPDGLAPLGTYFPPIAEIFSYQNLVAVRKGSNTWI